MKTAKKALLLVLCAIILVVATVMGTLAYLTDIKGVSNTFTVGSVGITLDEADVDLYGQPLKDGTVVAVENADRVVGNEYKLISGHTYTKDPTVTVTKGSEPAYVRMFVVISDITDLKAACDVAAEDPFYPDDFVDNTWDETQWKCVEMEEVEADTGLVAIYEFRYIGVNSVDGVVDARNAEVKLDALFDTFTMPGTADKEALAKLDDLNIDVVAHAIQADGFVDAAAAWTAFDQQLSQ